MLNYPAEVVFDEFHFGQFVQSYFSHQYYFDIHPPLGKLMIFWFAKIFGFNGQMNFSGINSALNSGGILILRFLPALFGAFFVLLIYYLILKMKLSKRAAFLGACLVLFDNAILAQSKFVLIDIFLLFFGFLSLYFLLCFKDSEGASGKSYCFLALAAISSSLSFSIKWTGLSFFAFVLLYVLIDAFKKFTRSNNFRGSQKLKSRRILFDWANAKKIILNLIIITVFPFLVYYSPFVAHFNLLYKSGPGNAYMSAAFQQALSEGNNKAGGPSMLDKFVELNQKMYFYNSTLKATHPYSSKWYQWPLDKRPIWYWTETVNNKIADIYLIGNPVVWWSVLFAIIFSVFILPSEFLRKKLPSVWDTPWVVLLLGYFLNLLPFIFISRVAFLYHYLSSLVFGILIIAFLYDKIFSGKSTKSGRKNFWGFPSKTNLVWYLAYLSLVVLVFLLISPLTYGIPVSTGVSGYYNSFIRLFF